MTPALAIILARGGSKGLPRKNALPIAGRPCIEWTIQHAVNSHTIGDIIVSTDDEELLAIARRWTDARAGRVIAMPRPADLASDTATIDAAARSALAMYEGSHPPSQREGAGGWASATDDVRTTAVSINTRSSLSPHASRLSPSSPIVILYGNVPVRPPDLTDRAVKLLVESGADSVQSYAPVGKYHPWWMARVDPDSGTVRPWEGDVLNHGIFRRQDLPPAYVPDGGVIAVTREALMLEIPAGVRPGPHAFFGREDRRRGVINPEGAVVDIDSRTDMLVAEAILSNNPSEPRPSGSGAHASDSLLRPSGSPGSSGTQPTGFASPAAYFITFHTHGTWLHGDVRGSVDRFHNQPAAPFIEPDADRELLDRNRLQGDPVVLTQTERKLIEKTIAEVCRHREWQLLAVNARSNHVHLVVKASCIPEAAMNSLKAWCTRRLIEAGHRANGQRMWVRHGSTRYLWDQQSVLDCMNYTLNRQDEGGNTHGR